VCYCTYKSSQIAFNDDPSRKSLRQAYQAVSASDGLHLSALQVPVASETEIHRSERKAGFIESATGLLEAAVAGTI
jgi:hypothetical protein